MKPRNNSEVRKAYLKFAAYLMVCVIFAVLIFACFLKTSGVGVKRRERKSFTWERVYTREIALSNSVDSVYQYMKLMNTSPQINDVLLQGVISTKKMNILKNIQDMEERDCKLYRQLLGDINLFLGVKDSIRLLKIQEEMVKNDLMQCIKDNWKTRRNLNVGSGNNK